MPDQPCLSAELPTNLAKLIQSNELGAAQEMFKECIPMLAVKMAGEQAMVESARRDAARGKVKDDDDNTPDARNLVKAMTAGPQMMDDAAFALDNQVKDAMHLKSKDKTGLIED